MLIAISGNDAPHFSSYTSDTLYFPAGDTMAQCFTLAAGSDTTAATYSFAALAEGENLLTFTVNVEASVCENIAGPDRAICLGDTVQLGIACLPAPHPVDSLEYCYYWEPATGLYSPQDTLPLAFPDETTTYTVYVTTSDGELTAEDSVVVSVDTFSVEILPAAPSLCYREPVMRPGRMVNACEDDFVTLSLSGSYTSVAWSTGSTADSITVYDPGLYSVTVTSANGCEAVDQVEVEMCTATPLGITASIPQLCEDTVTLSVDTAFMSYTWNDGSGLSALQVVDTGTYSVTVEDVNGCINIDSIMIEDCNAVVDISIYDGFYDWVSGTDWSGGGMPIADNEEYNRGAVTLANLNDTDGDETPDVQDTNVIASPIGRNEIDLMRLDIPNPLQGGNPALKLKVLEGADKVAFWTQPFKGSQLTGMNGEYTVDFEGETSKAFYIEAIKYSEDRKDIAIEASYGSSADTVAATAFWVKADTAYLSTPTMRQVNQPSATYTGTQDNDCPTPTTPNPLIELDNYTLYRSINCDWDATNGTIYGFGLCHTGVIPMYSPSSCPSITFQGDQSQNDKRIAGKIFWEFQIYPILAPAIYDSLNVQFDVTRQRNTNTKEMISGDSIFTGTPEPFPWQDSVNIMDVETPNDDRGYYTSLGQNDNTPSSLAKIYSFDPPSSDIIDLCEKNLAFKVYRASLIEFVRIKKGAFKNNIPPNQGGVQYQLEGSRASPKEHWYTEFNMRRNSNGFYKLVLDTARVSVSKPISNSSGNYGVVSLSVADTAQVSTNGYTLEYYNANNARRWKVSRTGGNSANDIFIDESPSKKWSGSYEGIDIVIIENNGIQFPNALKYTYCTFKTQLPSKVNEMGRSSTPYIVDKPF